MIEKLKYSPKKKDIYLEKKINEIIDWINKLKDDKKIYKHKEVKN